MTTLIGEGEDHRCPVCLDNLVCATEKGLDKVQHYVYWYCNDQQCWGGGKRLFRYDLYDTYIYSFFSYTSKSAGIRYHYNEVKTQDLRDIYSELGKRFRQAK